MVEKAPGPRPFRVKEKRDPSATPQALLRAGLGEAADKSWGLRFSLESHFRLEFEAGRAQAVFDLHAAAADYAHARSRHDSQFI